MSSTKVAFPAPPPTRNTLTSKQRVQLLRTTRKLAQVLGSTPQFLDGSIEPTHVRLPFHKPRQGSIASRRNRRSIDSTSSTSSASFDSIYPSSSPSATDKCNTINIDESWRVRFRTPRPPLLKLAMSTPVRPPSLNTAAVKPSLETIIASPPPYHTLTPLSRPPSLLGLSASDPTFKIPSDSSQRRLKMERLKRKLGDGVPLDLVFPEEHRDTTPAPFIHRAPPSPPLEQPERQSRVVTSHAPLDPNDITTETIVDIRTKSVDSEVPLSSPRKLCSIIESPDEHGTGWLEEFGIKQSVKKREAPLVVSGAEWDPTVWTEDSKRRTAAGVQASWHHRRMGRRSSGSAVAAAL